MFAEIKTLALDLWADAQAGEQFGDEDCNGGANGRPDNRGDNRCRLNAKLRTDTDRTVSGAAQRRRVDDGGAKSADHAANAVDAEGVQRVIIAELRLQERHGIVADEGGDGTKDNGARSEENTPEIQSIMRNSYAVCRLQ